MTVMAARVMSLSQRWMSRSHSMPSERLRFILSGGQPHRASERADTPGRPLEEQLAEIAQEVTLRGQAAERRRQDEAEAARQKRIRWEAAMEQARIRVCRTIG
ncbi:hypothetical protein [Streptomyces sp. NPDC048385]|uniref:hypothetical protein n=1 Tax=unclassified Streptomyces TaxID=2593676 RepID=UPI00343B57B6